MEHIIYKSAIKESKVLLYIGVLGHRFLKICWRLINTFNGVKTAFALHGSAIIFSRSSVKKLKNVFDEKIFLYTEEEDLAYMASKFSVPLHYVPDIVVEHREDGSDSGAAPSVLSLETRKSIIYRYEKWHS